MLKYDKAILALIQPVRSHHGQSRSFVVSYRVAAARLESRSEAQLPLCLLDLVSFRSGGISVHGLDFRSLDTEALVHHVLGTIAAPDGLVQEALAVTVFEDGKDILARYVAS